MLAIRAQAEVEAQIPVNDICFFSETVKHPNTVMLCIGEGYFVKVTVEKAQPIIQRRINVLKEKKAKLEAAMKMTT